jgi:acyl carrier protein
MADRKLIVEQIMERLATLITGGDTSDLTEDKNLTDYADFDSLGVLETLVWIEDEFDVSIPDEELLVDHFNSVAKMADYVMNAKA